MDFYYELSQFGTVGLEPSPKLSHGKVEVEPYLVKALALPGLITTHFSSPLKCTQVWENLMLCICTAVDL